MVGRASSPSLVGREPALEALRRAVHRPAGETRSVILVEGEAGIGKTRFLAEFARELEDDPSSPTPKAIVFGHCVQLTEGSLPYGPIVEVLDELARRADRPLADRAVRLRDELSGSIEGAAASSAGSRGRLFLELRHILVAIAAGQPLIVVIDDLHWADRSTLDLVAYLASRLAETPVIVLLAYRSDELDRRHPLKPLLAELQRGRILDRIVLSPLGPESASDQIRAIVGDSVDEPFAHRVIQLADGNPFHIEELVALGGSWSSLPASLRDVLLARIERLDASVLSVVRDAAVIGREAHEAVLALVIGRPGPEVRDALRQAVDHFILVPTGDGSGYRFRHALLREAVYEDILPADRIALHRRVADTLTAEPSMASTSPAVAAAELARHRDAGHQPELAREAYARAGELAMRAHAWSEAAAAYERVLGIDAGRGKPLDVIDLPMVREVAQALWYADRPRQAEALLRATLERAGPQFDPLEVAQCWQHLAVLLNDVGDDAESRVAGAMSRAIAPRRPANRVRVRAMGDLASQRMIDSEYRKAIRLASCVIAMADEMGAQDVMAEARAQRGPALLALGHVDEGRRDLEAGRRIATESGDVLALGILLYNGGIAFSLVGAFEEGLAWILEASSIATDLGLERSWNPWLLAAAASYAYWLGRWDEADRHLAGARSLEINGPPLSIAATIGAILAVHRRDTAAATALLAEAARAAAPGDLAGWWRAVQARASLIAGDAPAAMAVVDEGIDVLSAGDDLAVRSHLACLGAEAAADLADRMRARRDAAGAAAWVDRASGYAQLATDIAAGRVVRGSLGTPLTLAHAAHAEAHARRSAGDADPSAWKAAVAAYFQVGALPTVAWTRFRLAEADLVVGDRVAARDSLYEARATALAIGDVALVAAIDGLGRRGRLDLDKPESTPLASAVVPAAPPTNPWNLSDRESEVLALVAEGLTNRVIAGRLFISEKTASSHVTHILDKLGVSSRTEAALAAARAGVLAETSPSTSAEAPADSMGIDRSQG